MDDIHHQDYMAFETIYPDPAKPLAIITSTNHSEQYSKWVASQSIIVETIRTILANLPRRLSLFQLFSCLIRSYRTLHRQHHRSWEECAAIIIIGCMIGVMAEQVVVEETQTSQGQDRKTAILKRVANHTGLTELKIKAVMKCDRFFRELESKGESAGLGKNSSGTFVLID